jgi:hypothetical protein
LAPFSSRTWISIRVSLLSNRASFSRTAASIRSATFSVPMTELSELN